MLVTNPSRKSRLLLFFTGLTLLTSCWYTTTSQAQSKATTDRWVLTSTTDIPTLYYQGVTSDSQNLFFSGTNALYRTDLLLGNQLKALSGIPTEVREQEGYNHIGGIAYDQSQGGRLLLPLECYYIGGANGGNTCQTGSIAVAEPQSLAWRYHVKLDPTYIKKAMWLAISPDRDLVWTSSGRDLIAYRTAEIAEQNAAPNGPQLKPIHRLVGIGPKSSSGQITGGAFLNDRLLYAFQDGNRFKIKSVDTQTGKQQTELARRLNGESEGLLVKDVFDGTLHWQIMPYSKTGPSTFGSGGVLLNFKPRSEVSGLNPEIEAKATLSGRQLTVIGTSSLDLPKVTVKYRVTSKTKVWQRSSTAKVSLAKFTKTIKLPRSLKGKKRAVVTVSYPGDGVFKTQQIVLKLK